ncbi:DUF1308 domain-containing protein [Nocardia araoensis]|uniref:DUF1308 domain-containing protein n=1 Tax=Nocardia araoensis TaxID=228600 RepID=UPI0012F6AD3B|nr:DUF1308 domain-containing protein [Nocardia araoensis]
MEELLSRRLGRSLHDRYRGDADELRHAMRKHGDADEHGGQQIAASAREVERSSHLVEDAHDGQELPEGMQGLLAGIRATGVDGETTARVERAVLKKYSEQRRVRETNLGREFLNNKSRELRERGESADAADASARRQVDEYLAGERAQKLIIRDATARTTEWADKIGLTPVLREVGSSPRRIGPRHVDDLLERFATQSERAEQLPKGLKQAVALIENSGADPRAVADAKSLLHDRYHDYRQQPMANTYRETLLEQRAEFARHGFPPHVADRLAERQTEAFTETAKAQRMIDSVAANNTSQWFNKMQAAAERDGVSIADRLAATHRYEQQPLSGPELRAAGEKLTAMHERLDATQQRLNTLLDRSPELAEKGADRWQAGIDAHRDIVTRFSDRVATRTAAGDPVTRRMINDAALQGPEAGIRGYEGEIRMAQKLDNIHDLGPLVDVSTPTGARMASEVDIVTDEGRVWHEVKTNDPDSQRSHQKDLEAQARRQLAISHTNPEYWVDGKPPELKMHFMNGVHPTVKSRIEALRIEDENGHIVDDHRIEVIDES